MTKLNIEQTGREFVIHHEFELKKIISFAKAGVRRLQFRLGKVQIEKALTMLEMYAIEHDVRIVLELIAPSGERITVYLGCGIAIGAIVGFVVGGPIGALVGAGCGSISGLVLAHTRISVKYNHGCSDLIFCLN